MPSHIILALSMLFSTLCYAEDEVRKTLYGPQDLPVLIGEELRCTALALPNVTDVTVSERKRLAQNFCLDRQCESNCIRNTCDSNRSLSSSEYYRCKEQCTGMCTKPCR